MNSSSTLDPSSSSSSLAHWSSERVKTKSPKHQRLRSPSSNSQYLFHGAGIIYISNESAKSPWTINLQEQERPKIIELSSPSLQSSSLGYSQRRRRRIHEASTPKKVVESNSSPSQIYHPQRPSPLPYSSSRTSTFLPSRSSFSSTTFFLWLIPRCLGVLWFPLFVNSQLTNTACPPNFDVLRNNQTQDACQMLSSIYGGCSNPPVDDFSLWGLDQYGLTGYPGPTSTNASEWSMNQCLCSMPVYNLVAACERCQSKFPASWKKFTQSCNSSFTNSTDYPRMGLPIEVPKTTVLPPWVFIDSSSSQSKGTWQFSLAQTNASKSSSFSSSSSSTSPTSIPPSQVAERPSNHSSSSHVGVIVGGVLGSLAIVSIAALAITYLITRSRKIHQMHLIQPGATGAGTTGGFIPRFGSIRNKDLLYPEGQPMGSSVRRQNLAKSNTSKFGSLGGRYQEIPVTDFDNSPASSNSQSAIRNPIIDEEGRTRQDHQPKSSSSTLAGYRDPFEDSGVGGLGYDSYGHGSAGRESYHTGRSSRDRSRVSDGYYGDPEPITVDDPEPNSRLSRMRVGGAHNSGHSQDLHKKDTYPIFNQKIGPRDNSE